MRICRPSLFEGDTTSSETGEESRTLLLHYSANRDGNVCPCISKMILNETKKKVTRTKFFNYSEFGINKARSSVARCKMSTLFFRVIYFVRTSAAVSLLLLDEHDSYSFEVLRVLRKTTKHFEVSVTQSTLEKVDTLKNTFVTTTMLPEIYLNRVSW